MKHIHPAIRAVGYVIAALIIPPLPGVLVAGAFWWYGDKQAAKRALIVTAVAFAVIVFTIVGKSSSAHASPIHSCRGILYGDNVQFYNITHRNSSCQWARRMALNWERVSNLQAGTTHMYGQTNRWTCRARQTGYTMDVRCTTRFSEPNILLVVRFHVTADL